MSFESYRSKGRVSILMLLGTGMFGFVSIILSSNNDLYLSIIFLFVNFVTFFLFLVAMNGFANYYDDSKIFKNSLYSIIIVLTSSIIRIIIDYTFIDPILEQSSFLTSLQVVAINWVFTSVVALISSIFYRRSFYALAEKSDENIFKQAGSHMFTGGVLAIVLVGAVMVALGWILAFKGFSSIEPKSSQT